MSLTLSFRDGTTIVEKGGGLDQVTEPGGDRYYQLGIDRFWSVTTILGGTLAKPSLMRWFARRAAEAGRSDAPYIERDRRGAVGTAVHEFAEWKIGGGDENPISVLRLKEKGFDGSEIDEITQRARHFDTFCDDYAPEFYSTELTVLHRKLTYAGTTDFYARIGGNVVVGDIKTSKHLHGEWALQLAAYGHATSAMWQGGEHVFKEPIRKGVILHLTPDGYRLYPVELTDELFGVFKHLRAVWTWRKHSEDTALQLGLPNS